MDEQRGYVQFTNGVVWWAKPRERPCICIDGVQRCAYHANRSRPTQDPITSTTKGIS